MKTRILTAGAILGALMLPVAAQAQVVAGTIVGAAVGGPVGAAAGAAIGAINAGALSSYVATHTYPTYVYQGDVVVGPTLPSVASHSPVPTHYSPPPYHPALTAPPVLL